MSDTLRDQRLGLGFKQAPKPAKPPRDGKQKPGAQSRPPAHGKAKKPHPRNTGKREDIDLAKAYAIRAQREKDERIAAERSEENTYEPQSLKRNSYHVFCLKKKNTNTKNTK